ncbi:MAG: YhbY family RNA-binding protein [Lentisphaeraceae bacterium]|nr:YhbY family RNA-binding protein [Lentisphaeraceae bacterium]
MDSESFSLTGKQKKHLRALGNRLEAKIVIGHGGISENCLKNLDAYLKTDELVKVRLKPACGIECKEASLLIREKTNSSEVQVFGKTILLYRKNEEEPLIKLP